MTVLNLELAKEHFVFYTWFLFFIISVSSKDELLRWMMSWLSFFLFYYGGAGSQFDATSKGHLITLAVVIVFQVILARWILRNKIRRELLSWRTISVLVLFFMSFILHWILIGFGLPWFSGYILTTISFLVGLLIFKRKPKDGSSLATDHPGSEE